MRDKIWRIVAYGIFVLIAMLAAAQPAYAQSCAPRAVVQGNTFTLAPYGVSGTVQKSAVAWQPAPNVWYTEGGNYYIQWTFNQPIPANWINFGLIDVDVGSPSAALTVTLGGGSTATVAQLTRVSGGLVVSGSGVIRRGPTAVDQSGQFRINSAGLITSLRITGTSINGVDNIGNQLFVRPPCVTVQKVSQFGTGSFSIGMTNVAAANATLIPSTALTTTTAGTAVSSPTYFARDTRNPITLTETVPAGWHLSSVVCTDRNAASTGNPSVIGTFVSPRITIPAANVRPEADILCRFTNGRGTDLAITKNDGRTSYIPGGTLTYQIVVTNNGPLGVIDARVNDALPAGITSANWTCGNVTGGGVCGAPSGTGAIVNELVDLPVGASVTYALNLAVPSNFTGNLVNRATVTAPAATPDRDTSNNSATDTDVNLTVAKALTAESGTQAGIAEAGETLTYQITVTNPGATPATGYAVQDRLDANTTFVSADNGGVFNGSIVDWTGLTVPANSALVLTVQVSVNTPLPAGLAQLANIAKVPGAPDPACPSAQCVVTPIETAVTYTKSTTASNVAVGDVVPYTLTARVFHSPTTGVLTLTDTLGTGLDFTAVTSAGAFTCNAANPLVCTLPAGTAVGTYNLAYTATVNAAATGSVTNAVLGSGPDTPTCGGSCGTNTPVIASAVTYAKTASTAGPVQAGDVITYTLTTTISNSAITSDVVLLTDTLGTGIDFTAVTSPGAYGVDASTAPVVRFTLPAGTGPGTYSVSYTATVNAQASGSVSNAVVGSGPDNPLCTVACGTTTPVTDPAVTYAKSVSAPAATVAVGDTLTYTLTATVATSPTTGVLTLTDTLGTGLDFTAVTSAGAFACNVANPLVCTLPAGTAVGTYNLTYTATVNAAATGSVTNAVLGAGPDTPTCVGSCGTSTPVTSPSVTYVKSTSAPNVVVGDTIDFTLTATVANSQTTGVVTLTDTLGTGLDFTAVTSAGAFTCNAANPLVCTLPAGTAVGTYSLTYTATVNASATGSVTNAVLGSGPDTPTCGGSCDTDTSVTPPSVTYAKSASAANVVVGDTIEYTLTATVANSQTTGVVTLTDTLGAGLDFTAVTSAGAFTCNAANPLICALPAGTAVGTYSLTYTATVNASATGSVSNAVLGTGPDTPTCAGSCNTNTLVVAPAVTYAKTASTAGPVQVGDVITYTLTTTIANSLITSDVVLLTDTLGTGIDFTAVTSPGAYGVDASTAPVVRFTLPAGTGPGTYSVSYTATVNAQASGSVNNAVVGSGPDNPTCTVACGTTTPVTDPTVTYGKSASAANVKVGDTISYTLTATVANAATTGVLTLTDTLGTGLDFTAVTSAGLFTCNAANPLVCTLPAGTAVGTYSLTYTATVNASATGSVANAVLGSGPDTPTCAGSCGTDTPVVAPSVSYAKTASTAGPVQAGDVITYTLTTIIANSLITSDVVLLTDTLGTGIDFTAVTSPGAYGVDASTAPVVRFTLPAGTGPGTYSVSYTATVNAQASGSVRNAVVGSGPDNPTCTVACGTTTPVTDPTVTYAKSASAANVKVGDTISYTLTATVANAPMTGVLTLTDTLGTGLDFTAVTSAGAFTCNSANPLVCTLPAGTAVGTYSLTYTATVNASATGSVTNAVLGTGPDTPTCAGSCNTDTPVVAPSVSYAKTASTAGPVQAGDVITYTLTTIIANSLITSDVVLLTDTLGTGIDFTAVTSPGAYGVDASTAPVVRFTLPAGTGPGTYSVSYTATVNAQASGSVRNAVVGSGPDNPICTTACGTDTPVEQSTVTYAKSAQAPTATVKAGDVIAYTLTATVANSPTTGVLTLTDTLGTGLDFTAVTSAGAFTCNAANPLVCTLPAGTAVGTYSLTYNATVNAAATGGVTNAVLGTGPDTPICAGSCNTSTPVEVSAVTYAKSVRVPAATVTSGDVLTYTLTATVANAPMTGILTLTDTLGAGLDFTAVTSAGAFTCNAANPLVCTLPAGTTVGTYSLSYTATVNAAATGSVTNAVLGTGPDNPTCAGSCNTSTPVEISAVTYAKSVAAPAATVTSGDVLTYTLTATVANAPMTGVLTLTDTLGNGLDFGAVTDVGAFTCNAANPLVCTLPAGTVIGTYSLSYTATVNAGATGSVTNAVLGSGPDSPTCAGSCNTSTPVEISVVTYAKSVAAPSAAVTSGDVLTYTLTATVANAPMKGILTLTDTLGNGLDFGAVTNVGAFTCNAVNPLVCTLPAGTAVGTYSLTYTATVNARASGMVDNNVLGSGPDNPGCAANCSTSTPVVAPVISVAKSADPVAGETVMVGQAVRYALVATVANSATTVPLILVDTPDPGLTITGLPAGCVATGPTITCTLPAGTPVGTHQLVYDATINENAGTSVRNLVTAAGGGGSAEPSCVACMIEHKVELPQIRLVKTASVREAKIGDLIRYTLSVENVGERAFVDGSIIDTPPAGFTYVEGSLQVLDSDGVAAISGQSPLRFQGIDVAAGETATLTYLMRVGAGVRQGSHINQAQAYSSENQPVSNQATAQVELVGDPLIDETLVFGTVFDDRDGDGWQDSAALSGLHVQGGFAPGAYVSGSTMIDRGQGMQAEPDASAPMLHGIKLGHLSARQSEADPVESHRIVIRQRLSIPAFTDDFVLTNGQGVTIRMNAAGETSVEKTGDAAKGLNGAEPKVERRVAQGEGGYVVDYIVDNAGIDERGIPGVRIASVEGLIMETDQFGRYHLEGIPGGAWERGRNFILKVDPATLPSGAAFTTDNPLLRRITPGIPVRFDWGVKLPVTLIEGRSGEVELELGKVLFAPGSAEVREPSRAVIDRMTAKISEYQGGEIVIDANGDSEAIAFERAEAVKTALLAGLDAEAVRNLRVVARGKVDDPASLVVGLDEGGALLGSILFDTDKADIKPQFEPLLDRIATWLGKNGGGTIAIIGHTDVRGSFEYNTALGMRRARSVYEGLARRLPPEVRANVRVESKGDPTTPVEEQSK